MNSKMLLLPVISQPGANLAQLDSAGARVKERVRQGVKKEKEKRDVGARVCEGRVCERGSRPRCQTSFELVRLWAAPLI